MSARQVREVIDALGSLSGVRAALLATADGAFDDGRGTRLDPVIAIDIAKTVRRMLVASNTVGVVADELVFGFGSSRLLVRRVRDDMSIIVVVERAAAMDAVRMVLSEELEELKRALMTGLDESSTNMTVPTDEEIDAALAGTLGPALTRLQDAYAQHAKQAGILQGQALGAVRDALRAWLSDGSAEPGRLKAFVGLLAATLRHHDDARRSFSAEAREVVASAGG